MSCYWCTIKIHIKYANELVRTVSTIFSLHSFLTLWYLLDLENLLQEFFRVFWLAIYWSEVSPMPTFTIAWGKNLFWKCLVILNDKILQAWFVTFTILNYYNQLLICKLPGAKSPVITTIIVIILYAIDSHCRSLEDAGNHRGKVKSEIAKRWTSMPNASQWLHSKQYHTLEMNILVHLFSLKGCEWSFDGISLTVFEIVEVKTSTTYIL